MALILKDRVKETCTGTSGDMTLAGAVSGFVAFSVIGNAKETYYALEDADGTKWEVGIGTYTLSGTTFSRDTILANQAGTTATQEFSGGTHTIYCVYPADKSVHLDVSGNLSHTVDISSDTNLVGGTGITLTGDTLSTTDSEIEHDSLSGFVAAEHVDWAGASAGTIHATNYTDTNTMGSGFTVSATTDSNATTITQGDDLMFAAGTGITCETTADGTVTISCTVTDTDTNTMGSGFTVSATTDNNATTITQGDDLFFAAGTGITCETTADGTVTISSTVTDTNTEYTAGTLLDLSSTTFNVDLSEASAAVMAEADEFIFLDNDDGSAAKRESLSDLLDTVAGTVGTTGLDRSGATLVVSDLHPVGVSGSADQLLTDDGDGTVTSEANLTFDGGILTLNGGLVKNTDRVTADYTVDTTDTDSIILADGTSNAINITLPDADSGIVGRVLTIKKIDSSTNAVNIIGSASGGYGADDIDEFNLEYTLYAQHDTITIVCGEGDGTASNYQWWVISEKIKPHQITVRNSSAQSISAGGWRHLEFQDTDSGSVGCTFSTSTDKITIARPGRYLVSMKLGMDSANDRSHFCTIAKNQDGTTIDAADILPELYMQESGGETSSFSSGAATVTLGAGDTLNVLLYVEATCSTAVSLDRTETTITVTEIVS